MKKIISYFKEEKGMLILIAFITFAIVGTSIWITVLNNHDSDLVFWLEVVLLGFLVNFLCSLVIIAFFDDKNKRDNQEKKDYFLSKVNIQLSAMVNMIITIYNKATNDSLKTLDEKKDFLLNTNIDTAISEIMKINLAEKDAPLIVTINSSVRENLTGNWLEYYFDTFSHTVKCIISFKEVLIQYISKDFYECLDKISTFDDIHLNYLRKNDFHIINNSKYTENIFKNNSKIQSLLLLNTIIINLRKIEHFLSIESNKKQKLLIF